MPTTHPNRTARRARCAWAAAAALAAAGCQSGVGPLARWQMARDGVLAPAPSTAEVGDARGPVARLFTPERASRTVDPEVARAGTAADPATRSDPARPDPETKAELDAAMRLYNEGQLAEAEKIFARLDRKKVRAHIPMLAGGQSIKEQSNGTFWTRDSGLGNLAGPFKKSQAPWGEGVLFYLAESQYRQGKLTAANDTYAKLASTYSGSQYLEKVAEREYAIATEWLEAVDPDSPPERREKLGDRVNGRLPFVDVKGHALQVLEHVRHHDPLGPLADDAVMRIADFHFDSGHFEEASTYYDQLITDHPKSPLALRAHVRSIDAKIKAYIGPDYDSDGLEEARKLIGRAMTAFPERDPETSEFLSHSLDLINDQQAEIAFRRGEFYRKTGYAGAAELSYAEVRARWPRSEWAAKAKDQLDHIARAPRKEVLPSKIMTAPGAPDPFTSGASMGSMVSSPGGLGGLGGNVGP